MDITISHGLTEEQWLELRKKYIGSTEAAALLNRSKFQMSYYKLWHIKNGTLEDDFEETEQTAAGKRYEANIADHYSEKFGRPVKKYDGYHTCDEFGIASSYDFLTCYVRKWDTILECKNIMSMSMRRWDTEELPLQYELQAQQQMMMMPGVDRVVVCCLVDGWNLKTFTVKRHEGIARALKKQAKIFWENIKEGHEPEIDWNDCESAQRVHGWTNGNTENADETQLVQIEQLRRLREQEKFIGQEIKEVKTKLMVGTKADKLLLPDGGYLDLKMNEDTEGKVITADMVGKRTGGRKGYRRCQLRGV